MSEEKIYVVNDYDECLFHILMEKLTPLYEITLIKVKSIYFDFSKKSKFIITTGLIDFLEILFIQYKNNNFLKRTIIFYELFLSRIKLL